MFWRSVHLLRILLISVFNLPSRGILVGSHNLGALNPGSTRWCKCILAVPGG